MLYADYKAINKKDVMKSKPLLLVLLSTISITGIVYASDMSNTPLDIQEVPIQEIPPKKTFDNSDIYYVVQSLKTLYNKRLLTPDHIKMMQSSTYYNHLQRPISELLSILLQYRTEVQNEINEKIVRQSTKKYPLSQRWFNVMGAATYTFMASKMQDRTYNAWLQHNTNIIKDSLASYRHGLPIDDTIQDIALKTINPSFLGQMTAAAHTVTAGAFAFTLYSVYKLYMHYTYISSREKEIAIVDAMIPLLENIEKELAQ
jgi:hypothetical protein